MYSLMRAICWVFYEVIFTLVGFYLISSKIPSCKDYNNGIANPAFIQITNVISSGYICLTINVNIGSAAGGTFTLTVDTATTAAINWNAAAADVQTALSNAVVLATVSGTGSTADPWVKEQDALKGDTLFET